jgi:hypothetical protein
MSVVCSGILPSLCSSPHLSLSLSLFHQKQNRPLKPPTERVTKVSEEYPTRGAAYGLDLKEVGRLGLTQLDSHPHRLGPSIVSGDGIIWLKKSNLSQPKNCLFNRNLVHHLHLHQLFSIVGHHRLPHQAHDLHHHHLLKNIPLCSVPLMSEAPVQGRVAIDLLDLMEVKLYPLKTWNCKTIAPSIRRLDLITLS